MSSEKAIIAKRNIQNSVTKALALVRVVNHAGSKDHCPAVKILAGDLKGVELRLHSVCELIEDLDGLAECGVNTDLVRNCIELLYVVLDITGSFDQFIWKKYIDESAIYRSQLETVKVVASLVDEAIVELDENFVDSHIQAAA